MTKYKRKKIVCPHCGRPFYQPIPLPPKNWNGHLPGLYHFICPHCDYSFSRIYKYLVTSADSE